MKERTRCMTDRGGCTKVTEALTIMLACYFAFPSVNASAQTTNDQANREYGRQTFVKKTTVVTPSGSSSAVREYGSQSLGKSSSNAGNIDSKTYVDNLEKKAGSLQGPAKFLGQIVIEFKVGKSGTIDSVLVSKSSSMPQIDSAAKEAVKAMRSFGPLPKSMHAPLMVDVTFDGTSSGTTTHAVVKNP